MSKPNSTGKERASTGEQINGFSWKKRGWERWECNRD